MKLGEVRAIARSHSINSGKLSKIELIKSIQAGEGNFDCYATASGGVCDQEDCLWRDDCFESAQQGDLS